MNADSVNASSALQPGVSKVTVRHLTGDCLTLRRGSVNHSSHGHLINALCDGITIHVRLPLPFLLLHVLGQLRLRYLPLPPFSNCTCPFQSQFETSVIRTSNLMEIYSFNGPMKAINASEEAFLVACRLFAVWIGPLLWTSIFLRAAEKRENKTKYFCWELKMIMFREKIKKRGGAHGRREQTGKMKHDQRRHFVLFIYWMAFEPFRAGARLFNTLQSFTITSL